MNSRQEKLWTLSRINRGRAIIPSFLADLSHALGEPVEVSALLSLSETDLLTKSFRTGYQHALKTDSNSYRRSFHARERKLVIQLAECLGHRLAGERGFLITKLSETCGAVGVSISALLRRAERVLIWMAIRFALFLWIKLREF